MRLVNLVLESKIKIDTKAVLPSRSALSDLCLIADLFEKMPLNWSSLCLKSPLFGLKSLISLIFTILAFDTKRTKSLKISLNMEYFQRKVDFSISKNYFWNKSDFKLKMANLVRFWSDFW